LLTDALGQFRLPSLTPIDSDLLGHASISFTLERYPHVAPSIQGKAAATMENLLVA
jgi:hypothetical protein